MEDRLAPVADFGFAFSLVGTGNSNALGMATDSAGSVYVAGYYQGTVDFDPDPAVTYNLTSSGLSDAYVAKFDSQGDLVWAKSMGGTGEDRANDLAVSPLGVVTVVGEFSNAAASFGGVGLTSAGQADVFVTQLDSVTGNTYWARGVGGTGIDRAYEVALDDFGDIHLTGHFSGTVDFNPDPAIASSLTALGTDAFVSKLDVNGQFLWARRLGGSQTDLGRSIVVDGVGNVITTGTFLGTADFNPDPSVSYNLTVAPSSGTASTDIYVSKLDASGNFLWAGRLGGIGSDQADGIAVDSADNLILTGAFTDTADFDPNPASTFNLTSAGSDDAFVAKLGPAGTLIWANSFSGSTYLDRGTDVAVDADGNIYTTGVYSFLTDFDPSPTATHYLTTPTPFTGISSIYVSRLDSDGQFVWARAFTGGSLEYGNTLALDPTGQVYAGGYFSGTVDFDPSPDSTSQLNSRVGGISLYVAKLTQLQESGTHAWQPILDGYATDPDNNGTFDVIDSTDTRIRTSSFEHMRGLIEFDLSGIEPTATVLSATLTGGIGLLQYNSDEPFVNVDVYGYVGDGVLTPSDATASTRLVGRLTNLGLGDFSLNLDPSFIQSVLSQSGFAGLILRIANGQRAFFYSSEWPYGTTPSLTLNLQPAQDNAPPVSNDDLVTLDEDTPSFSVAAPGVLGNDTAPGGTALTATLVDAPIFGSLTLNSNGSFTYVPQPQFNGLDRFTYRASNGQGLSRLTTVVITVNAINDAPSFNITSDNVVINEDAGTQYLSNFLTDFVPGPADALDETNQSVSFSASTSTTGTLRFTTAPIIDALSGSVIFAVASNTYGTATVTVRLTDNGGTANGGIDSVTKTFTITVNPVNDAPETYGQNVSTSEDTPVSITLNATDIDGDSLTYLIVTPPAHGTITGSGLNLVYTPNPNYSGADTFTYRVSDGSLTSIPATMNLNVSAVNDAPTTVGGTQTTAEDTPVALILNAVDVDSTTFSSVILAAPLHGTLTGSGLSLVYTPDPNYNGTDSFIYRVSDGSLSSAPATFRFTVTPVNDAPNAQDATRTTAEDAPVSITLNASDIDADPLTSIIVTAPSHGTITGSGLDLVYTPNPNYNGPDSFTYRVSDGTLASGVATVSITVSPVNDAPAALGDSIITPEDTPTALTLNASDVDGDALTYVIVSAPTHGTVSGTAPNLVYTPNSNYNGSDSITYRVSDGSLSSATVTISINVTSVNNAPTAVDSALTTAEDTAAALALNASDVDANALTSIIVTAPSHGTLTGSGLSLVYTPNPNYNGTDSFTYRVSDGSLSSAIATVSITVTSVNDAPSASSSSVTTAEDASVAFALNAADVDGGTLSYVIVSAPGHGTLTGSGLNLVYTPNPNYNGPDSFTYRVSDGSLISDTATVSLTVTPVNDAPTTLGTNQNTSEDTPVSFSLNASDIDSTALSYEIVSAPAHGTITGTGFNLVYTPASNYSGTDSFTYRVSDGSLTSTTATIIISVTPVNDAPNASGGSVTTAEDTPVAFALNAADVDGNTLSYVVVSAPGHGTLTGSGLNLVYTPNANYNGPDSFTYRASDGTLISGVATVSITVTSVNDAPNASSSSVSTAEDASVSISLNASDVDNSTLSYVIVSAPGHGTLTGSGLNLVYTPNSDYHGADTFTYRVSDGSLSSALATVSITVTPVNDAPTAVADTYATNANSPFANSVPGVLANDLDRDGDPLSARLVSGPSHGTLTFNADGSFLYSPNLDFQGSDTFTYVAHDGQADSTPVAVSIQVEGSTASPPQANAGLDRSVNEGDQVRLAGTGSAAAGRSIVAYEWDFHYDGVTFDVESTRANSSTRYRDNGVYTIALRVRDSTGQTAIDTLQVNVRNVAPTTDLDGPAGGVPGQPLRFEGDFSDPGSLDTHTSRWQVRDDSNRVVASGSGTSFIFVPGETGTYHVQFTVTDDDGGEDSSTQTVTITPWALQPDPFDSTKTALVIGGTPGNDQIVVNPGGGRNNLKVSMNGNRYVVPVPTGRIIVLGNAGDDNIQVAGGVKIPTLLIGGDGDDRLMGGNGPNILVGGAGRDQLQGDCDDLLIPDEVNVRDRALREILEEWTSTSSDDEDSCSGRRHSSWGRDRYSSRGNNGNHRDNDDRGRDRDHDHDRGRDHDHDRKKARC